MNKRHCVVIRIVVDDSLINEKRIYHLNIRYKGGVLGLNMPGTLSLSGRKYGIHQSTFTKWKLHFLCLKFVKKK